LLEEAVALDPMFAEAYRKLAAYQDGLGNWDAAKRNSDLAFQLRDRLPDNERYRVLSLHHEMRGRLDSAVHFARVLIDRYPSDEVARNNLGFYLAVMGRFDEALEALQGAVEISPRYSTAQLSLALGAAGPLGLHALADSALAIAEEAMGGSDPDVRAMAALYRNDFSALDSLTRLSRTPAQHSYDARFYQAGLASMYGRIQEAISIAQTEDLTPEWLRLVVAASYAAGTTERSLPLVEAFRSQPAASVPLRQFARLGATAYGLALAGDLTSARDVLGEMDSLAAGGDFHPARGTGHRVRAILSLAEGRETEALEHLDRGRSDSFGYLSWDARFFLGEAQRALGHNSEAIAQYEIVTSPYRMCDSDRGVYLALRPLAHERLGSLFLLVGDTAAAQRHLSKFVGLWTNADAELLPRVDSARAVLSRLGKENPGWPKD
jgi:tetratricopeptide (TPR) repeat protein